MWYTHQLQMVEQLRRACLSVCGIPGVLGVGNGTKRIAHGQTITIDGDAGVVMIHDDDGEFRASGDADLGPVSPHVRA